MYVFCNVEHITMCTHVLLPLEGCGLAAMVSKLTYGRRQWEHLDATMRRLIPKVDQASRDMVRVIDADTTAFNDYMVSDSGRQARPQQPGFPRIIRIFRIIKNNFAAHQISLL